MRCMPSLHFGHGFVTSYDYFSNLAVSKSSFLHVCDFLESLLPINTKHCGQDHSPHLRQEYTCVKFPSHDGF